MAKKPPRSKLEQLIRDRRLPGWKSRAQEALETAEVRKAAVAEADAAKKAEKARFQQSVDENVARANAWGAEQIANGLRERHEAFLRRKGGDTG